jgi:hypothetical protein
MTYLLHELAHLLVGLAAGLALAAAGAGRCVIPWTLLASLLVDADHALDYALTVGPRWDPAALLSGSYFEASRRVIVLLHSWELAAGLLATSHLLRGTVLAGPLLGLAAGLAGHLLVDQVWYRLPPATYFLLARWRHRFRYPTDW